jgi:hypothetical protein
MRKECRWPQAVQRDAANMFNEEFTIERKYGEEVGDSEDAGLPLTEG